MKAEPIVDYGAQPWRVVKEDAPDPDRPNSTIRRARVQWAPDALLSARTIDQRLHEAAKRLLSDYEASGPGGAEQIGVYVDRSIRPGGVADDRLDAQTRYRQAHDAVGQVGMAALSWCVLSHGTVAGWAECRGWNPQKALGLLLGALERLAEHYEERGTRRPKWLDRD